MRGYAHTVCIFFLTCRFLVPSPHQQSKDLLLGSLLLSRLPVPGYCTRLLPGYPGKSYPRVPGYPATRGGMHLR